MKTLLVKWDKFKYYNSTKITTMISKIIVTWKNKLKISYNEGTLSNSFESTQNFHPDLGPVERQIDIIISGLALGGEGRIL